MDTLQKNVDKTVEILNDIKQAIEAKGVSTVGTIPANYASLIMEIPQSGGSTIIVEDEMSDTSINAVQNRVIKEYVDNSVPSLEEYALKEDIPNKVSDLENDSHYLTGHQSLANYATKSYVDNKISPIDLSSYASISMVNNKHVVVTMTESDSKYTLSKTFSDIRALCLEGDSVVLKYKALLFRPTAIEEGLIQFMCVYYTGSIIGYYIVEVDKFNSVTYSIKSYNLTKTDNIETPEGEIEEETPIIKTTLESPNVKNIYTTSSSATFVASGNYDKLDVTLTTDDGSVINKVFNNVKSNDIISI